MIMSDCDSVQVANCKWLTFALVTREALSLCVSRHSVQLDAFFVNLQTTVYVRLTLHIQVGQPSNIRPNFHKKIARRHMQCRTVLNF